MKQEDYRWVKLKTGENRLVTGFDEIQLQREVVAANLLDNKEKTNNDKIEGSQIKNVPSYKIKGTFNNKNMIEYYRTLKRGTGYCRFTNDDDTFIAYLFENSIQDIDIEKTSDFEFTPLRFQVPVIIDKELFLSSEKREGFELRPVLLSSIRKFDWLKGSNSF